MKLGTRVFGGGDIPAAPLQDARVAVLPLCYEHAPSYGAGAADGPRHILGASAQLEILDEETLTPWGDVGLYTAPAFSPEGDPAAAMTAMTDAARSLVSAHRRLLTLGGDHAVSLGPITAVAEVFPDVGVLQIDAHPDLRDTWNGSRYNHACVMRRVVEDLHLPLVQVGIRAISPEDLEVIEDRDLRPFFAHAISPSDNSWIESVIACLPQTVYITIDLDGLDPAEVPGTGTPEPGGLSYRQVVSLIHAVGQARTVVAADVVELAKIEGSQVSEVVAARLAEKLIHHGLAK